MDKSQMLNFQLLWCRRELCKNEKVNDFGRLTALPELILVILHSIKILQTTTSHRRFILNRGHCLLNLLYHQFLPEYFSVWKLQPLGCMLHTLSIHHCSGTEEISTGSLALQTTPYSHYF